MRAKHAVWVLDDPVADGGAEVVLADQRFADHVGVGEGRGGVREEVREVEGFVLCDLQAGCCAGGELVKGGDEGVGGGGQAGGEGGEEEGLHVGVFVVD